MGVPGLWDALKPAATRVSLSTLAKAAYQTNRYGLRALTLGIDASLWIFHASVPTSGENPFLRTIFFKICTLLQQPVLPVFVFDGPNKPNQKRGVRNSGGFGTRDIHSRQFKALLDECGLEWWNAPGEAEAELAVMNRQGKIDAVLSDDVDALLFGATCLLRNNSQGLTGTQHVSVSKGDAKGYDVYRSSAIHADWTSKENTALRSEQDCRMAMIFVALFAGGDYVPEGLDSVGPKIALALAHAGMSDQIASYTASPSAFKARIPSIYQRIKDEMYSNSTGHIGKKFVKKADGLDMHLMFPPTAMDAYLRPATSPLKDLSAGWPGFGEGQASSSRGKGRNLGRGDLEGMARACEEYFEWGTKEIVSKKFVGESTGVFLTEITNAARKRRLEQEGRGGSSEPRPAGTLTQARLHFPSSNTASSARISPEDRSASPAARSGAPPSYIIDIVKKRPDPTSEDLTEYRILYDTKALIDRTHAAMRGHRPDPQDLSDGERAKLGMVPSKKGSKGVDEDDEAPSASQAKGEAPVKGQARVWIADWLVKDVWPSLVDDWDAREEVRLAKEAKKGKVRTKSAGTTTPKKGKAKAKPKAAAAPVPVRDFFASTQAGPSTHRSLSPAAKDRSSSPVLSRSRRPKSPRPTRSPSPVQARPHRSPSPPKRRAQPVKAKPRPKINTPITISDGEEEEQPKKTVISKRKVIDLTFTPTPPRRTSPRLGNKPAAGSTITIDNSSPIAGPSKSTRAKQTVLGSQAVPLEIMDSEDEDRARTLSPPDSLDRPMTRPSRTRSMLSPLSTQPVSSSPASTGMPARRASRSILSPSSQHNASSPTFVSSPTPAISKSKSHTSTRPPQIQMNLGMPIVSSSSTTRQASFVDKDHEPAMPTTPSAMDSPLPSLSPSKSGTANRASPSPNFPNSPSKKGRQVIQKKKKDIPARVILDGGEEGGGVIDCTRGGRLLDDSNWKRGRT